MHDIAKLKHWTREQFSHGHPHGGYIYRDGDRFGVSIETEDRSICGIDELWGPFELDDYPHKEPECSGDPLALQAAVSRLNARMYEVENELRNMRHRTA